MHSTCELIRTYVFRDICNASNNNTNYVAIGHSRDRLFQNSALGRAAKSIVYYMNKVKPQANLLYSDLTNLPDRQPLSRCPRTQSVIVFSDLNQGPSLTNHAWQRK